MSQPRRMLNYSFELTNRTNVTSLLLFQLKLGLICKENYRFAKYTPVKCLDSFVQSAVNACRQRNKNLNSSVIAETRSLAKNSYGYQNMDHSRHSITRNKNDEKIHATINIKMFEIGPYQRSTR